MRHDTAQPRGSSSHPVERARARGHYPAPVRAGTGPIGGSAVGRPALLCGVVVAALALLVAPPASADAPASTPDAAAFEVEFLEEMIDHHQMGVHMAEPCIEKAVHEALRQLCQSIHHVQAAEIEQMQGWLLDWYGVEHEPSMDDPAHHDQMMELESLSGGEFEVAFLEMMSEHHVMAVVESQQCMRQAQHRELRRLCQRILTSQLREIMRMQTWLCRWYGQCAFSQPPRR